MGPSTRAVHAGAPASRDGEPFLPAVTLAAPYHLAGPADASPYGYGRDANPTWTALEDVLGALEGGRCLTFASGMAAASAVLDLLTPGSTVVLPTSCYLGVAALVRARAEDLFS